MNEREEELISSIYRSYLAEEVKRPEVAEAQKKLAAHFQAAPVPAFEPVFALAACSLVALFCFFYQIQPPARKVVHPQTQPVMLALTPKPVVDAAKPALPQVLVKKVSSGVGPTMVYQNRHHDVPITVIWVFPAGRAAE